MNRVETLRNSVRTFREQVGSSEVFHEVLAGLKRRSSESQGMLMGASIATSTVLRKELNVGVAWKSDPLASIMFLNGLAGFILGRSAGGLGGRRLTAMVIAIEVGMTLLTGYSLGPEGFIQAIKPGAFAIGGTVIGALSSGSNKR